MPRKSNAAEALEYELRPAKQPPQKAPAKPTRNKISAKIESEISFIEPPAPDDVSIPEQKEHFRLPARFGAIPIDEAPLGWEVETRPREVKVTKFQHAYPTIRLPFQEVQRFEFGHNDKFLAENEKNRKLRELFPTGANRLFFGDNLHVMRQLPCESIDLIYIDPPFFSGRNYNIIFGDKNEMRSFSDIWEDGMPGYLVWLNARLWEMKRLLKPTGSIYVHLDWHAVHYVKVEMDKIFGYNTFRNEIVWHYSQGGKSSQHFARKHDTLLWYSKSSKFAFNSDDIRMPFTPHKQSKSGTNFGGRMGVDEAGRPYVEKWGTGKKKLYRYYLDKGKIPEDVWSDIQSIQSAAKERIGYPTQKPEAILERVMKASSNEGDVCADFFCGGGTAPSVAQRLNRRWIACDQSRIAVAITADRLVKAVEEKVGTLFPVPDFTVEHWGIYEAPKLEQYSLAKFRDFVVQAFGGRSESVSAAIHGTRHGVPLYVGEPSKQKSIQKEEVVRFAKAVFEERRKNHGVMLAWAFSREAREAAKILEARENKRIDFVRLNLVPLESSEFRQHITEKHKDYEPLLCFIQPPDVRLQISRKNRLTYSFDVSESIILNQDGEIANVQWDFHHKIGKFVTTPGYSFLRKKGKSQPEPILVVEYTFPKTGEYTIACSVQDDQGGERTVVEKVLVS